MHNQSKEPNDKDPHIPEGSRILFVEDYEVNREVGIYQLELVKV